MPVRELLLRPEVLSGFPETGKYRWLELYDKTNVYGYSAIAEHEDMLELHVTLVQWGKCVRQSLEQDVTWLKGEALRLGKRRIMGIRANDQGQFDGRLFKFAGLFGFTEMHTVQTATLRVDSEE
ncbi:hypothetical protein [uncultured Pseudodesulfovibrio sp.]|uniref:hypothetical protein n=1 Tax=uncultured Pseudodesulfovibrio sp. TaxID=2035858 RepID=UPI0029C8ECC6|nr:hypothetical protein [uncultured Pseudodesulfovibrio sp.]